MIDDVVLERQMRMWTRKAMESDDADWFDMPLVFVMFCWMGGRTVRFEQGQMPFDSPGTVGGGGE